MSRPITSQSVVAYSQCPRKAFLLLHGEPKGGPQHEYEQVLAEPAATRSSYIADLSSNELDTSPKGTGSESAIASVEFGGDLVATCDALTRRSPDDGRTHACLEPHLAVGTRRVSKEQKLALAFAGYVLWRNEALSSGFWRHGPVWRWTEVL